MIRAPAASGLAGLRAQLAEALAGGPVDVHDGPLDAVGGPCLIVGWGDPWLDPGNVCAYLAHPSVICVAGRVEPGAGVELLEELVVFALDAIRGLPMAVERVESPALTSFANVEYLTARIVCSTPLVLKGPGHGRI